MIKPRKYYVFMATWVMVYHVLSCHIIRIGLILVENGCLVYALVSILICIILIFTVLYFSVELSALNGFQLLSTPY